MVNTPREDPAGVRSPRASRASAGSLAWAGNLSAVVFNTCFAVLVVVTLCGIVFITRPKAALHDIPPQLWLPLLVVMAPAQIYAQFLSWSTIFAGHPPTGPAIAMRQMAIPGLLKPVVALVWLCNFGIGLGIVVSLSKPHPGNPPPTLASALLIAILAFWLVFAANVYLLLAVKTFTANQDVLHRVWQLRLWIGLAMAIFAAVYYAA